MSAFTVSVSPAMGGTCMLRQHNERQTVHNPFGGDVLERPYDYHIWKGTQDAAQRYADLIANQWCVARVVPI